jgi:uncharacterized membrane-anchored protein
MPPSSGSRTRPGTRTRPGAGPGTWPGTREPLAAKVPEITAMFWVIKILTTGMGEATSDYLAGISLAVAGGAGVLGFAVALWIQLRAPRYSAPVYWFAVMMVAVFGTMAADVLHAGLGVPYVVSTTFYAVILGAVFWLWYRSEGTLSIHSIVTRRRETYYWLTVLATFALGTAAGDLTATAMHLGFLTSGIAFGVVILVPAVAWWRFRLNAIFAFWFAYVTTRPLGASFADFLSKPHAISGMGLGDGPVAGVSTAIIVVLVGYVTVRRRGIQPPAAQAPATAEPATAEPATAEPATAEPAPAGPVLAGPVPGPYADRG